MTSISLPVTFRVLSSAEVNGPLEMVSKTVTSLQKDEVLVKVAYASLNPMDPKIHRTNMFQWPLPMFFGSDFSGTVVAAGTLGEQGDLGMRVGVDVCGFTMRGGSFGQYVVVHRASVVPRESAPQEASSTLGVAWTTAYESLMLAAQIHEHRGKWIYIAGAAGGVGHFAVQLAKVHGLKVIGSGSKDASMDLLRQLQVDHIINYRKQNVAAEIMTVTENKGADFVYDPTYSPASFAQSAAATRSGGQWIKLGQPRNGDDTEARQIVKGRQATFVQADLGRYFGDPQWAPKFAKMMDGLRHGVRWCTEGKIKPHISTRIAFDLEAFKQSFDDFLTGSGTSGVGKTVVKVG